MLKYLFTKPPKKTRRKRRPSRAQTSTSSWHPYKNPLKKDPVQNQTEPKYRALPNLFTPTERKFLKVLESISGNELKVFGKVRISDILTPSVNKFQKGSGWHWLFSQISQKHVDFVITDKELNLVCAVELNDPSHEREDRKKRDEFVLKAFNSANVPLVMINTQHQYLEEHIAETIAQKVAHYGALKGYDK